jgi:hypothetical protein
VAAELATFDDSTALLTRPRLMLLSAVAVLAPPALLPTVQRRDSTLTAASARALLPVVLARRSRSTKPARTTGAILTKRRTLAGVASTARELEERSLKLRPDNKIACAR